MSAAPDRASPYFVSDPAYSADRANSSRGRNFQGANPSAHSVRTLADEPGWDAVIPPPTPTPDMFYGVLGWLGQQAAEGTEVNPVAAMAAAMSWLSAGMGRNPYIAVGDECHHLRLYSLHVGRSSRGGKGMALGLLKRVIKALSEVDAPESAPQMHTGGLSTREGLALLIHDGYKDGKEEVPAIEDKRLFIIESEFANVLAQGKREGNTLSTCLRDAWDGIGIRPAIKSSRIWASRPHIAMHGSITPTELRTKMGTGDLTNGFANRFLMVWGERTSTIPFPSRASDTAVDALANEFRAVLRHGLAGYPTNTEARRLTLSRSATGLYVDSYRSFATPHPGGEMISGLLQRRAPMMLRIAGLFAMADMTWEISREHMDAAWAWMNYYAQSVHMIFAPTVDTEGEMHRSEEAEKLHLWLSNSGDWRSRKEINRECFSGHLSKTNIDAAIECLAMEGRIERREIDTNGPTMRTDYRVAHDRPANTVKEFAQTSRKSSQSQNHVVIKGTQSPQGSQPISERATDVTDSAVSAGTSINDREEFDL